MKLLLGANILAMSEAAWHKVNTNTPTKKETGVVALGAVWKTFVFSQSFYLYAKKIHDKEEILINT